jgi:hypothetical protein
MITALDSQRYASMIKNFSDAEHREYHNFLLSGGKAENYFSTVAKHLAGKHDQSTHGNGHGASVHRLQGGSGLTQRQMFENRLNTSDNQVKKVYAAEELYEPVVQRNLPTPVCPKRTDFASVSEYSTAYDNYSKEFNKWSLDTSRLLVSPIAQNYLDGSNKGVKKYFQAVTTSPSFQEKYGDYTPFGEPKFSLVDTDNYGGQYAFGFKNGVAYSTFKINKGVSMHEPTILHEIAHYATTISVPHRHESHGKEFAQTYIDLTREVMGDQQANRLENELKNGGVAIGN